jgi:IS30 family transposase
MSKHLTDHDRLEIEHGLRHRKSLRQIARDIGKSLKTVSREIQSRSQPSEKGAAYRIKNRCDHRESCEKIQLCMDKPDCLRRCASCHLCNAKCADFVERICARLSAAPYVCNGCEKEKVCVLRKRYYNHRLAHTHCREKLVTSREGANISEGALSVIADTLGPLVRNGQSVHHVMVNNPDRFTVNEKTVYRYINSGLLPSPKRGDMPRSCMLKPRRGKKPVEHKVDPKCRIGRTYQDYQLYIGENPGVRVVEMDSVVGRVGGKVLLTLQFVSSGLMLAFLRERNDSQSVIDVFGMFQGLLGTDRFRQIFPVLLTDNGSEFSNPTAIETAPDGQRRSHLFYCDPCASWQKGHVERNHEFLRLVRPKGTSFDDLDQGKINEALSHINSYSRLALNDRTPFEIFSYLYGEDILGRLGIRRIPANDIVLKPGLI